MKNKFSLKNSLIASACFALVIGITGCQLTENTLKADRSTNQEVQDYRDMLAPREAPLEDNVSNAVPDLKPYIADTSKSMKPMPLVSVAINQSIPLRDALFELAKQADYDLQLDPRLKGSIIYTARNKPFDLVISQIAELGGLRYRFEDDTLKIELDTPYTKNYKVEYLSFTRESKSSIDTSTKVESGDSKGGPTTGSSAGISSESKTDFWGELDTNIKQILEANSQLNYQITSDDPELAISNAPAPPPVPPVDERMLNGGPSGMPGNGMQNNGVPANPMSVPNQSAQPQAAGEQHSEITSNYSAAQSVVQQNGNGGVPIVPLNSSAPQTPGDVPTGSAVGPTTSPPDDQTAGQTAQPIIPNAVKAAANGAGTTVAQPQPQQVQLNVNSLPSVKTSAIGGATYQPSYSINKQAGLISVYATQKAHEQIEAYLDLMRKAVTAQVLIEAKVLEVELNDEFTYGINWDQLFDSDQYGVALGVARGTLNPGEPSTFVINPRNDLNPLVSAIQRFGTIHALASPRLTVLNNQSAVLNVAENQVYFEIKADREENTDNGDINLSVDSTIKNVPEGVLINVMPSVDMERNTVAMQVRPTISRITGYVSDPAVQLTLASVGLAGTGITSDIPIVSTKEVDTVVNIPSGQTLVMGGLLEDRSEGTQRAVPVLGEIPIFGAAFRGQEDIVHKSEIVVLLKATIIASPAETVHNTDRDLYRVYSNDRRPFKL